MVGTVESTEWLTPTMVRIKFAGSGLERFAPKKFTDQYVICQFVPEGAPYSPPFGDEASSVAPEHRPRTRRFTVRRWDDADRVLTVDFVVHGSEGYAGRWAQRAQPGDLLQMRGPGGGYRPDPDADWYLMAGDESALPAIAASLEVLPAGRSCEVALVTDDADHEIALESAADLSVRWVHRNSSAAPDTLLVDAVGSVHWHRGRPDVFVHGEAAEVRAVRRHLVAARGIDRNSSSISPYWRRHHDDEAWRAVKKDWLAEADRDLDASV